MSVEVHPGGCPHRSGESDGGFLIGIGFALKHGEFGLLGKSRFFHNGTSMYAVQ